MSRSATTIDRLFDRSSRLPYPLRARTSPFRRWFMLTLFVVLSAIIGAYWFLTDARRVRDMAEQYLSQLSGAHVTVGRATLSIFEGLRLDDVRVYCQPPKKTDANSVLALPIFSASQFQINYDFRSMIRGDLQATRIIAINPHVLLAQDLDTDSWNYQQIVRPHTENIQISAPNQPLQLPEIDLRDARYDYIESHHGVKSQVGSISMEGHLVASPDGNRYRFDLQSRGASQGMGPSISGGIDVQTGQINARLKNFDFGPDMRAMLPSVVRQYWEQLELSGRLDTWLLYSPPTADAAAKFRVETDLDSVALVIHPDEWMSRDEMASLANLHGGFQLIDRFERNLNLIPPTIKRSPPLAMEDLLVNDPIRVQQFSGKAIFTQDGIDIPEAAARIENNTFVVSGHLDGYSPDAPFNITLGTSQHENLVIPAAPKNVGSMPAPIREAYLQLKPQGECRIEIHAKRDEEGGPIAANGEIDIVKGAFQFVKLPYPVSSASGKILFGPDPKTGIDRLQIDLRGHGVPGGPNADATLLLDGYISPLGPDAGALMHLKSDHIVYEDVLRKSFPPALQDAFNLFDAPGHGMRLRFTGGFACEIFRPIGMDRDVYISTDVRLDDAGGVPVAFPYPMDHVSGLLKIRDGSLDVIDAKTTQGDATVKINGRLTWTPHHDRDDEDPNVSHPPADVRSDFVVTAANVPIDQKLLAALAPDARAWIAKLGIGGKVDVDGKLIQRPVPSTQPGSTETDSPMRYDLRLALHDGVMQPAGSDWQIGSIAANLHVVPDKIEIEKAAGTRGDAKITGSGTIDLPEGKDAQISAKASAVGLALDKSFYSILPTGTKAVWDQVHPNGAIDLDIGFNVDPKHPFTLSLRPHGLAVQPDIFPLKLDHLTGEVRVADDVLTFDNIQAKYGDASLLLDGTQRMDHRDWNIKLAARDMTVNDTLLNALPAGIRAVFSALSLKGQIAVDFDHLRVNDRHDVTTQAATTMPVDYDLDFASTIWLKDASMDIGVPVDKANGRVQLNATLKNGHLDAITGGIEASSLTIAGRPATNLRAKLLELPDGTGLRLDGIQADIADGTMAGQFDLLASDSGPSRYVMSLSLRNADIATLTPDSDQKIQGRLSASLSLEGPFGDANNRRGRGDVSVTGKQIVKLPLMLGLFQMATLALPISGPLNDATARYNIDGPIVTFERIELRGANMLMSGDGRLDFTKKTVDMHFSSDNPTAFSIPIVGPLMENFNHELLQIHVKGSIESPKVSGQTMGTVTTTVDQVLSSNDNNAAPPKKPKEKQ